MIRKTISLLLFSLVAIAMSAQTPVNRQRMIITNTDGSQKTYDVSRLSRMTFDNVDELAIPMTLVSTAGYSVKISTQVPEACVRYLVAAYPTAQSPASLSEYIKSKCSYEGTASKEIEIGGLRPETAYTIAILAYDKYGIESGTSTMSVTTTTATEAEQPKVGYILYADGSWSKRRQTGRTPVGIIFSTTTTDTDKAKGYTMGYALALHDAAQTIKWSTTNGEHQVAETYTSETEHGFQTDKEGLSHTLALTGQGTELYPAADACATYSAPAPANSSGWYLPSSGQWFDVCVNLGGMSTTMNVISATEGYWNKSDDINNCISRINEYLSLSGSGNYSPLDIPTGDYRYYWTSSESSNEQAYAMYFDKDQIVIEIGPQFKQYGFGSSRVRAVLAF